LFSIEFSDHTATIVLKLSLHSVCGNIYNLQLRLDRSTSTLKKNMLHFHLAPLQLLKRLLHLSFLQGPLLFNFKKTLVCFNFKEDRSTSTF